MKKMKEKLTFIFVHGLSGWGSYDRQYSMMPYWGMRNGDLIAQLRDRGFDACAASVSPHGSAYDRACELYAQLTGTRTDYGRGHSERYGHERYGKDFTGDPLIKDFEKRKLVLIGHSFGGATVRLFSKILTNGLKEEGDFFQGGRGDRLFAVVSIASPHNGTTAYDLYEDPSFDTDSIHLTKKEAFFSSMMSRGNSPKREVLPEGDSAAFDMHIDNALSLNKTISTLDDVYYFSQPCRITRTLGGIEIPDEKRTEILFLKSSKLMGVYTGKTKGGFEIKEDWRANDGLVNTISSLYPLGAPYKDFDRNDIQKGLWNILPVYNGDHMSLQGGLTHKHEVLSYYLELLEMISSLTE